MQIFRFTHVGADPDKNEFVGTMVAEGERGKVVVTVTAVTVNGNRDGVTLQFVDRAEATRFLAPISDYVIGRCDDGKRG